MLGLKFSGKDEVPSLHPGQRHGVKDGQGIWQSQNLERWHGQAACCSQASLHSGHLTPSAHLPVPGGFPGYLGEDHGSKGWQVT